jgi:hypothetical protein
MSKLFDLSMNVSLPSDAVLYRKLLGAARNHLNAAMHRAAPAIVLRVRDFCRELIEHVPEYGSLLNGELLGELGVPDVKGRLEKVLETVARGVQVQVLPIRASGTQLSGGLRVYILRADFADVLALPAAEYRSNEHLIPWLEWLLVEGDRIIVADHDIFYDLDAAQRARSRSGRALMRPGTKGWRVPPEYSGVVDDNFLTRAFDGDPALVRAHLTNIVSQELYARI